MRAQAYEAPEHLVRELAAASMPPPSGGPYFAPREVQLDEHLAAMRQRADRIYAEGYVAGAAWVQSMMPVRATLVEVPAGAIGTLGALQQAVDAVEGMAAAAPRRRARWTVGRVQVYFEPRDVWVGVYVAVDAVYVLLVPCLVVRWRRAAR